jgi:hemerythrin-like domain-containing protein
MKATELLRSQHREVTRLFERLASVSSEDRNDLIGQIEDRLETHMRLEEDLFYPLVRETGSRKAEAIVPAAYEVLAHLKRVLGSLPETDLDEAGLDARMRVLRELIERHAEEDERQMLPIAEKLGADVLENLGSLMERVAQG